MIRRLSALLLFTVSLQAEQPLFQARPLTAAGLFTSGIEGPACDAQGNIFCVQFGNEHTIGKTTPDGHAELFVNLPEGSTGNGIRIGLEGDLYVADYTGHNILRIDPKTKVIRVFAHEPRMNQPNDLAITATGEFYASDPDWKNSTGQIWHFDRHGKSTLVASDLGTTNGIDISPDGKTLYVNESVQRNVWAFTIQADRTLTDKRLIKQFPDHGFDGMRVDAAGNLYVTRYGKGTVVKLSPKGDLLQEILLPGSKPSNLCFGGPDGCTVYVTEMEHGQLVQFRVDEPGLEWQRTQARAAALAEPQPENIQRSVAVQNVCAWPNLTRLKDGTLLAVLHNQPAHGTQEGDIECWASTDGLTWKKRSTITQHVPNTIRMNHAAGLAANGDFIVLCSGWTNEKQPDRTKQSPFRDAVLSSWVLRSKDGGYTWRQHDSFPKAEVGWTEYIPFGDIWVGDDGALHTSCYQGSYTDPAKSFRMKSFRSWHFRSDDDGQTWTPVSIIGTRHDETNILPLGGKRWLAAARVNAVEIIASEDNGQTWQTPVPVTDKQELNGHLTQLQDGRLLLTYGVRVAGRHGVCAKFSKDSGKTWSAPLRIAHSYHHDCGYPASVQRSDGKIVTVYYSKDAPEYPDYHMGASVWTP